VTAQWAAELAGDLAVAYADLLQRPPPRETHSLIPSAARFEHWRPLLRLAIEAGIAVTLASTRPSEALRALADVVRGEPRLLADLRDALAGSFSDMTHDDIGRVFGAMSWDQACTFRSGIVFIAELSGQPIDLSRIDQGFTRWSEELYSPPLDIPAGMPVTHWWWYRAKP
jgi:hypothetical protein